MQFNWQVTFDRAFRPFFLLSAVFAVFSAGLWMLYWLEVSVPGVTQPEKGWYWWHAHEMLFGFAMPVIAGFLLTAVQNWTGVKTPNGWPLALMSLLWLVPRLLNLASINVPLWTLGIIDGLFQITVAVFFGIAIVKGRNWRNLFFVPMLVLLAVLNFASYVIDDPVLNSTVFRAILFWFLVFLVVIGGRIIPFFTRKGAGVAIADARPVIEWLAHYSVAGLALLQSLAILIDVQAGWFAVFLIAAALSNAVRAMAWKTWRCLSIPLLWSLHTGYWLLVAGLLLMGLEALGWVSARDSVMHVVAVGGLSLMILAMTTRVSLGHAGYPLVVKPVISLAYIALILAMVVRTASGWSFPLNLVASGYAFAAFSWGLAFTIFVVRYWRILTQPKD